MSNPTEDVMRIRLATLTMAFGLLLGFNGTATANHMENNCSVIEGDTLRVCERQDVMGDAIDLTTLRTQLTAVGFDLPSKDGLVQALQGEATSLNRFILIHNILPLPQYQSVTATITYDGAWHVTMSERAGFQWMRSVVMVIMLIASVFAAIFSSTSLKPNKISVGISGGVVVGLLVLVSYLGFEILGLAILLLLIFMFLVGLKLQSIPILMALFVAIATSLIAYSYNIGKDPAIVVEWVLFCILCIALQYITYIVMKFWRRAKPKFA